MKDHSFLFFCKPMNIKKHLNRAHLWLGATVGLITSFSGITGSLYVWQPELTALFAQDMLRAPGAGTVKYEDYLRTAKNLEAVHKDSLLAVRFPNRERKTIRLDFKNGDSCYYHPGSGRYLGENPFAIAFFDTLLQLHRNMCLGAAGQYIIGTASLIFALLILGSGFYLWWHIYKNRRLKGFSFKRKANPKVFNFNLHKLAGIYGLAPLFIIAVTGGYFTYYPTYKDFLDTLPGFEKESKSSLPLPETGARFDLAQTAHGLYPHYYIRMMSCPTSKKPVYRFRFINSNVIQSGLRKPTDIFTTRDRIITKVSSYETFSKTGKVTAQMYPVHIGELLGFFNRVLVFLGGFLPAVLYVTGLRFFLFRKELL